MPCHRIKKATPNENDVLKHIYIITIINCHLSAPLFLCCKVSLRCSCLLNLSWRATAPFLSCVVFEDKSKKYRFTSFSSHFRWRYSQILYLLHSHQGGAAAQSALCVVCVMENQMWWQSMISFVSSYINCICSNWISYLLVDSIVDQQLCDHSS